MNYTDTAGNPATGVVWSPGPLPGTVWVLPYSGASASEARVVHVRKRSELSTLDVDKGKTEAVTVVKNERGRPIEIGSSFYLENGPYILGSKILEDIPIIRDAAHRQAFNDGRGLPPKDWYAALGYSPRDVVRDAEAGSAPPAATLMLDLATA